MGDSHHVGRLGLSPGVLIASRYELVALIGCGAMGEVWRARHVSLHENVALKLVGWTDDHRDGAELASRFHLEARLAAGLSRKSRHIVSVTDHGIQQNETTGEAIAYLVMEELLGESLDACLERTGPMPLVDVAGIVAQIARGLSVAHAEGVIHRDLKPGNVFLARGADGEPELVKILDFGIAKFRAGADRRPQEIHHQTQRGLLLGTLPYVSPEQARGWASLDHRADVWSLGVITYLLLTNEYPFSGSTPSDMLARIFSGEYVPVHQRRELPPMFADLFAKAFHRHLDMRFQSATDFANALALASNAGPFASPRPSSAELAEPAPIVPVPAVKRRRGRWVAVAAFALFAAGTSAALVRARNAPEGERMRQSTGHARVSESSLADAATPVPLSPGPLQPASAPTISSAPAQDPAPPAASSSTRRPRRSPSPRSSRPGDRSEIF